MNPYLTNRMRYTAATTANTTLIAKTGEVTDFNPQSWSINVTFYPLSSDDGNDAGAVEVPLQSSWVGNGWGLYCAPALGTEVTVLFENGNLQLPIGLGFIFSGQIQPLEGIQSEECWLVHKTGSIIKLTNDGDVSIIGHENINLQARQINMTATSSITLTAPVINLEGNAVLDGDLTTNDGNTTISSGVITTNADIITSEDVKASGISLKTHTHSGVTSGSDDSGPPNP